MIDFVIKVDLFKSMYLVCDLIKVVNIQSIFLCTDLGSMHIFAGRISETIFVLFFTLSLMWIKVNDWFCGTDQSFWEYLVYDSIKVVKIQSMFLRTKKETQIVHRTTTIFYSKLWIHNTMRFNRFKF